jgi:hypothetical protein
MGNKLDRELYRYNGTSVYIDGPNPQMPQIPPQPAPGMITIMCAQGKEHCRRVKWVDPSQANVNWNCKDENGEHAPRCVCH